MSNARIRALADEGRGSRGVSPSVVREMARWLELQEEADRCFGRSRRLEDRAVDRTLSAAEVVCSTNSTAGSDLLGDRTFDVVVVDEATQATEPSCLIPITRGRRVVLAGDHRQLPPTVLSREAERRGLARSLFERLAGSAAEEVLKMLTVQYRMHRRIMNFPSRAFYDGGLEADESVRDHTLRDLGFAVESVEGPLRTILVPEEPLVFIDTAGSGSGERQRADSSSRENPAEAEMVVELARALRRGGVPDTGIAAISPYRDQVDLIRKRLPDRAGDLEVRTVDGFQGREKEVVLLSLVRSNPDGELGFLEDLRRLNVAITRPRRKLIVVGDGATVSSHPLYARFADHVKEEGSYVTT